LLDSSSRYPIVKVQYFRATIKDITYPITLSIVSFYGVNTIDFLITIISDIIKHNMEDGSLFRG
jgi:hypothetical protein